MKFSINILSHNALISPAFQHRLQDSTKEKIFSQFACLPLLDYIPRIHLGSIKNSHNFDRLEGPLLMSEHKSDRRKRQALCAPLETCWKVGSLGRKIELKSGRVEVRKEGKVAPLTTSPCGVDDNEETTRSEKLAHLGLQDLGGLWWREDVANELPEKTLDGTCWTVTEDREEAVTPKCGMHMSLGKWKYCDFNHSEKL